MLSDKINLRERDKRDGRILTATMRSERLAEQSIIIRNLSPRGIGARARTMLPRVGEEVFLRLDGREIVGRVRWVRGDQFGIHLRDPIKGPVIMTTSPWPQTENQMPGFHVFDRFKPIERPWRPGVTGFQKMPRARGR